MYDVRSRAYLSRFLADGFLAGVWTERAMADRTARALDRRPDWLHGLVREVRDAYLRPPSDRPRELARFIELTLMAVVPAHDEPAPPRVRRWLMPTIEMGRRCWPVPELPSPAELAAWLGVSDSELAWFADGYGLERTVESERLRHYRYRTIPRRGGIPRVIERPKERLKAIQRRILHEILDLIPAHDAAHGFTRGRSAASHAARHVGRDVVVCVDLKDFFASVPAARVFGVFRTAGYPEAVAYALTGLVTNVLPAREWSAIGRPTEPAAIAAHHRLGRRLATPHLPQGAPTSPALANLAAFGLDRRLSGLAATLHVHYSRYADDLTFSGPARILRDPAVLRAALGTIVSEEGFAVNHRKSRLASRSSRQRVCGIVVNERLNVTRAEYDELKAIVHRAATRGPAVSDAAQAVAARARLEGRIAWVGSLHPQRGERLRRRFAQIVWPV